MAGNPDIAGMSFERVLGSGGFADVYLYRQAAPDRLVAVKVLRSNGVDEPLANRFTAEANAMAALSHPHIVPVYAVGVAGDGRRFIEMAYVPGGSLLDRVRQGPMTVSDVLRIGVQLCSAVAAAHDLTPPLLHRDIKPSNVLIDQYGDPVLTDFGVASWVDAHDVADIGISVGWAAPEVMWQTLPVDERSDVYSLGALLWNLLTGRPPFVVPGGDNSPRAIMLRTRDLPPPATGRGDVPSSLERLLAQTLSKDPGLRPQSARSLARALGVIERDEFGAVTPFKVKADVVTPPRMSPVAAEAPTRLQATPQVLMAQVASATVEAHAGDVPEVAARRRRNWGRQLIAVSVVVVLLVLVVLGGKWWMSRLDGSVAVQLPQPDQSSWQVGANLPPGPLTIDCKRGGTVIRCEWDYSNDLTTDTYLVRLPDGSQVPVTEPSYTGEVSGTGQYCVQVKVVRQDGRFPRDWSDKVCV